MIGVKMLSIFSSREERKCASARITAILVSSDGCRKILADGEPALRAAGHRPDHLDDDERRQEE